MKKFLYLLVIVSGMFIIGCNMPDAKSSSTADKSFTIFEDHFLDAYWKQYPAASIFIGYGKYYDKLVVPDSNAVANNIAFSKQWIDSLATIDIKQLATTIKSV